MTGVPAGGVAPELAAGPELPQPDSRIAVRSGMLARLNTLCMVAKDINESCFTIAAQYCTSAKGETASKFALLVVIFRTGARLSLQIPERGVKVTAFGE
jgi:hypothetical protein